MSLAYVQVPTTDFQTVHGHLTSFKPQHRNMHVRDTRTVSGHATMRSLHAMYATTSNEIEGMISGPGVFWHYKLKLTGGRPQMNVLTQSCSAADATRIEGRFLRSILRRVKEELANAQKPQQFSNKSTGEFYLQRHLGGISSAHPHCRYTVSNGLLSQAFVNQLQPWNLKLVQGR